MTIYEELILRINTIKHGSYAHGKLCLSFKYAGQRYIGLEEVRLNKFTIELKDGLYYLKYKSKYRESVYRNSEVIDDDIVYFNVGESE
jgi:hypothetical protein